MQGVRILVYNVDIIIIIIIIDLVFLGLLPRFVRYNKRNKLPSAQLVSVISLIWHHVSASEDHLQASDIKHIKTYGYNCTKF